MLSSTQVGALLSPLSRAQGGGVMIWQERLTDILGTIAVQHNVDGCDDVRISLRVVPARPWVLHLVYQVNGIPLRRVDTNDIHNGWGLETHEHAYDPMTGKETCVRLENFPAPTVMQRPVTEAELQTSFEAFAKRFCVELGSRYWTTPPGWR